MPKRTKSILFIVCVVMVFCAQRSRADDKDQRHASPARSAPVSHNSQSRPQVQTREREAPRQIDYRQSPIQPQRQPAHRERETSRVYAVPESAPVENNRLLGRHHHNHWRPRYNFYDNGYHFYPYVNIASTVDLSEGYVVVGPDGQNYYYDQGTFYLADPGGQYVAVSPPVGIIVNPLATNARQINVNDQVFYRYKGVFYVQVDQGYQVVAPVESAPDNS